MKIVHDYLIQMGGAERVVALMAEAFPEAEILTSATQYETLFPEFNGRTIRNSWMQHLPGINTHFKKFFPLYPWAFRSLGTVQDDLVWMSSSGFAKWTDFAPETPVFCYCHTPPRFFWQPDNYLPYEVPNKALQYVVRGMIPSLRQSDYRAAQRMTHLIANSRTVQDRIKQFYHRDSVVIHPPVDVERFTVSHHSEDFYLIVSRLVGYKGLDRAVVGLSKLGKRLVVIGSGPDKARLQSLAGPTVEFKGRLSDEEVTWHMQNCYAFVFPGLEDFGITPVEAQASGKPVLAFGGGGALETVQPGVSGMFFYEGTADSLAAAVPEFERQSWDPDTIRANAEQFSEQAFLDKMIGLMEQETGLQLANLQHA
ncbi:MAG: group 1 glycosyl transferase [Puniceicoccaceae bacterium 5H]|nr:MAG: group 1 glycosyl transferase [Puniceicoccaceae bacterium 5H]